MKWNTTQTDVPGLKRAQVEPGIAQLPLLFGFRVEKPMETRVPHPIFTCYPTSKSNFYFKISPLDDDHLNDS